MLSNQQDIKALQNLPLTIVEKKPKFTWMTCVLWGKADPSPAPSEINVPSSPPGDTGVVVPASRPMQC